MLFLNTAEIVETVSITTSSIFSRMVPDLQRAEDSVIKKYLGAAQYAALLEDYAANASNIDNMNAYLKALLLKCRPVIAGIGLWKMSSIHGLQISDAGYQMVSTDTHKQAFQWMKNEVRQYLVQIGYTALDDLLAFLEENKADYALWAADETAYTINKKFIINDALTFSNISNIGESRLTYRAMLPLMKKVEDFVIKGALGKTVFDDIKATIADPTSTQTYADIMEELQAATALFTINRAIYELPVIVSESGILLNYFKTFTDLGGTEKLPVNASLKDKVSTTAKSDAETYLKNVIDYLNETASATVFPLWYASSKYITPGTGSGDNRSASALIYGFY